MIRGMYEIRDVSFAEALKAPNSAEVLAQYARESAIGIFGDASPQIGNYMALEAAGSVRLICAYHGKQVAGFAVVLVNVLPHFGKKIGVTESIFVLTEHRRSGLGLRMLDAAERAAREAGAVALSASAPSGSRFAKVLELKKGYVETTRSFLKALK